MTGPRLVFGNEALRELSNLSPFHQSHIGLDATFGEPIPHGPLDVALARHGASTFVDESHNLQVFSLRSGRSWNRKATIQHRIAQPEPMHHPAKTSVG